MPVHGRPREAGKGRDAGNPKQAERPGELGLLFLGEPFHGGALEQIRIRELTGDVAGSGQRFHVDDPVQAGHPEFG